MYAIRSYYDLKDALEHINYVESVDSLTLTNQLKEVVGTYGPRIFWVEDGKLFYKRENLDGVRFPKIELLPIAKNLYINMTKFQDRFSFEYENGEVISSSAHRYNNEKEIWEKLEDESNTFIKD